MIYYNQITESTIKTCTDLQASYCGAWSIESVKTFHYFDLIILVSVSLIFILMIKAFIKYFR